MKHYDEACALTVVFLLVFISMAITLGFLLPYSYIVTAVIVAILLVSMIINPKGAPYSHILTLIVVLTIVIRNIYTMRTGFIVEPLYDGYKDIVTAQIFNEAGRALVIDKPIFDYTTSYPLLKILTTILSQITNIDILKVALILPSTWSLAMLLFFHLFAKTILQGLSIDVSTRQSAIFLSLLLFSISPDAIYYGMIYYMRFYSITLIYVVLYLLFSGKLNDARCRCILIVLLLAIPLSYSLFPYLLLFFLAGVTSISMTVKHFLKAKELNNYIPGYRIVVLACVEVFSASFYYVAENVLKDSRGLLSNLLAYFQMQMREPILMTQLCAPYFVPEPLQNPFNFLTPLRDLVIYAPAIVGGLLLLHKCRREKTPIGCFTIIALIACLLLHAVIEGMRLAFQTTLIISLYFFILLSALGYAHGLSITRGMLRVLAKVAMAVALILAVTVAFLSPWSHRFLALHYYDPAISFRDAGDHNPNYVYLSKYMDKMGNYSILFTDDVELVRILVKADPNFQLRILDFYRISDLPEDAKGRIYVIELNGFKPLLGPYGWEPTGLEVVKAKTSQALARIQSLSKVLDGGIYSIFER